MGLVMKTIRVLVRFNLAYLVSGGSDTAPAIITRSLAELTKIGSAYGASPLTFLSLTGVGDLFLTCSSSNSRNYTVGYRLGKGEQLDEILRTLGSVAEGVSTTEGVKAIVDRLGLKAPIVTGVSSFVFCAHDRVLSSYWTGISRSIQR